MVLRKSAKFARLDDEPNVAIFAAENRKTVQGEEIAVFLDQHEEIEQSRSRTHLPVFAFLHAEQIEGVAAVVDHRQRTRTRRVTSTNVLLAITPKSTEFLGISSLSRKKKLIKRSEL